MLTASTTIIRLNLLMQCKDIPDEPVLRFLAQRPGVWHNWYARQAGAWQDAHADAPWPSRRLRLRVQRRLRDHRQRSAVAGRKAIMLKLNAIARLFHIHGWHPTARYAYGIDWTERRCRCGASQLRQQVGRDGLLRVMGPWKPGQGPAADGRTPGGRVR